MKSTKRISALRLALSLLKTSEKRKYVFAICVQSGLSFLDLIGVALISLIGSLAIRGVQSQGPGDRVGRVLSSLGLENQSFQFQIAILSGLAILLLSTKTVLSYLFTKKLLTFLAAVSAAISSNLINKTLSSGNLALQDKTRAEIQYSTGDGVTAMTVGILGLVSSLLADTFLLIILVLGIFVVDPYSGITTTVFFGLVGFILYFSLHKRARKLSTRVVELNIKGSDTLFEVLGAFREIYVRNRRQHYVNKLTSIKNEFASKSAQQALLPNLSKYAIELSVTIGTLLVAAIQFSTLDSSRAAASLALFLAAGSRLAPALLRIQQSTIQLQSNSSLAEPTIKLINEYKNTPLLIDVNGSTEAIGDYFNPQISIDNVSFSYGPNLNNVFTDINLEISPGEMVAFVGPSGSGKSTLVDLILGLISPSTGSVLLSGVQPSEAVSKWPGKIGYVPQHVNLLNDTVTKNLQLGFDENELDPDLLNEALSFAKLEELDSHMQVGENGSKLSGGQKQRLGIARALVFKPSLLILDEATSALDSETESVISGSLEALKGEVTLIVVAHRLSTVKSASKIVYVEGGQLTTAKSFEELRDLVPAFDSQAKLMGL